MQHLCGALRQMLDGGVIALEGADSAAMPAAGWSLFLQPEPVEGACSGAADRLRRAQKAAATAAGHTGGVRSLRGGKASLLKRSRDHNVSPAPAACGKRGPGTVELRQTAARCGLSAEHPARSAALSKLKKPAGCRRARWRMV